MNSSFIERGSDIKSRRQTLVSVHVDGVGKVRVGTGTGIQLNGKIVDERNRQIFPVSRYLVPESRKANLGEVGEG